MPASDYLLDTCSYLRLSHTLAPFLGTNHGNPPVRLKLIPGFLDEFESSNRLTTNFFWASEDPHLSDRKYGTFKYHQNKQKEINNNFKFMLREAGKLKLTTGTTDLKTAATALEFDLAVVTDDRDLRVLIDNFAESNFRWIGTMDLLKLLLSNGFLDSSKIDIVVTHWLITDDTPYKGWDVEFKCLFGKDVPSVA